MIDEAMMLRECIYNLSGQDPQETKAIMQAAASKIDELRAALKERDAELELIRVERNSLRVDIEFSRGTAEYWKAEHLAGNAVIAAQRKVLEQVREALTTASRRFELLAAHDDATHNGAKPSAGYSDCQTALAAIQEQLNENN